MAQASAGQPLARPWLGIHFQTIDPAVKKDNSLPVDNGAWIRGAPDPPARRAGGRRRQPCRQGRPPGRRHHHRHRRHHPRREHPLDLVMSQLAPGKTVTLHILRNGQTVEASVTLGTRPANS